MYYLCSDIFLEQSDPSGPFLGTIQPFVIARELAGHPVVVHCRGEGDWKAIDGCIPPLHTKMTLRAVYLLPRFPIYACCLVLGTNAQVVQKLVDEMYKLQVLMMHNSLRKESGNDTAARDIYDSSTHAQLSMSASRISPTTALEFWP